MYVKIYKQKKSATQSAISKNIWILEYLPNIEQNFISHMSWNGSKDVQKQVVLRFNDYTALTQYIEQQSELHIIKEEIETIIQSRNKKFYLKNFSTKDKILLQPLLQSIHV